MGIWISLIFTFFLGVIGTDSTPRKAVAETSKCEYGNPVQSKSPDFPAATSLKAQNALLVLAITAPSRSTTYQHQTVAKRTATSNRCSLPPVTVVALWRQVREPSAPTAWLPEPMMLAADNALSNGTRNLRRLVVGTLVEANWILITLVKNYILFEWDSGCDRSHLNLSLVLARSLKVEASSHSL